MSGLEVKELSKSYGSVRALHGVSFKVPSGEHTALLGPSGCGKSTALRLIAGLDVPTEGEIRSGAQALSRRHEILVSPHRRNLALVFQDLALWPNLSARQNVSLAMEPLGLSRPEIRRRSEDALRVCKIAELSDRKPATLSGGQQQRLALARALAVRPDFLLLDEPFSGLDLVTKAGLLREIRSLAEVHEMTLLLVTHDPMEAAALCSQVILLEQGSVAESGPLRTLLAEGRSEILRVFREERRLAGVNSES
jgi:ABC-type Fe3+/spermidine/putrescine transport system ATPase subunit